MTRARTDATPMLTVPDWSPNGAHVEISTAIAASDSAGTNSQFPRRRASVSRSSGVPSSKVPVLTPRARDSAPITSRMTPVTLYGSTAPKAKVKASSSQNAAVVKRRGLVWSRSDRTPVSAEEHPDEDEGGFEEPGPQSLIDLSRRLGGGRPSASDVVVGTAFGPVVGGDPVHR